MLYSMQLYMNFSAQSVYGLIRKIDIDTMEAEKYTRQKNRITALEPRAA